MTNFESATRNALLFRVPGQTEASKGRNERMIESVDIFPTLVELAGMPALPACQGLDQPPTTACLQGESFAREFLSASSASTTAAAVAAVAAPKQYAFSQWPFPAWGNETVLREGYTVRSATGYRYTTYVPYSNTAFTGNWSAPIGDEELYDYNRDRWETTNFADNVTYAPIVAELRQILLKQYAEP